MRVPDLRAMPNWIRARASARGELFSCRLISGRVFPLGMIALMLVAAGCGGPAAKPPSTQMGAAAPAADFKTDVTIQDIMDLVVDPSADFLWGTVSTTVGAKGVVNKAPHSDAEWREVRRNAVLLMEAANMLKIPGRRVARAGTKSSSPGSEAEPEGTKALMDADRASWNKATDGLYDAAAALLKAAEAKNAEGILDAGNKLDEACEGCHLKYWYPKQTEILKRDGVGK